MDTMKSTLKMSVKKWKQKILNYVFLLIRIIQQVVWSEDELKQLGQIMVDNDVWIISDEIHCDIKRDGQTHVPLLKQCQITIRLLPQCLKVRHLI